MNFPDNDEMAKDKGGTRTGIERRQFVYTEHSPERRSGKERRIEGDRRSGSGRRRGDDRRNNQNSDDPHPVERRDLFRHDK
jgi:hypothetical protein